jgi:hypothetical protein
LVDGIHALPFIPIPPFDTIDPVVGEVEEVVSQTCNFPPLISLTDILSIVKFLAVPVPPKYILKSKTGDPVVYSICCVYVPLAVIGIAISPPPTLQFPNTQYKTAVPVPKFVMSKDNNERLPALSVSV